MANLWTITLNSSKTCGAWVWTCRVFVFEAFCWTLQNSQNRKQNVCRNVARMSSAKHQKLTDVNSSASNSWSPKRQQIRWWVNGCGGTCQIMSIFLFGLWTLWVEGLNCCISSAFFVSVSGSFGVAISGGWRRWRWISMSMMLSGHDAISEFNIFPCDQTNIHQVHCSHPWVVCVSYPIIGACPVCSVDNVW